MQRIRGLAGAMAAGLETGPLLADVPDRIIAWLTVMKRIQLCRVACADDGRLRAQIMGRPGVAGVPPCDPESVAALAAAKRRKRVQEEVELEDEPDPSRVPGLFTPAW